MLLLMEILLSMMQINSLLLLHYLLLPLMSDRKRTKRYRLKILPILVLLTAYNA